VTVPRDVPSATIRAKLRAIDPHHDLLFDLLKLVVVLALIITGIVLRLRPMPARVAGAGPLIVGVLLFVFWGKRAVDRPAVRERRLLAELGELGFPIHGYTTWLAADVPVLEITFVAALADQLAASVRPLCGDGHVFVVDERTLRVVLPPRVIAGGLQGGDPQRLRELLALLHDKIERVEMGGS
jgi:hypothetical protein